MQSEAASDGVDAAASYPEDWAKTMDEGGYTKQQILSADEKTFFWKKLLSRTFIATAEKSKSGFQAC